VSPSVTRQGGAGHDEAAFFGRFKQDGIAVFRHRGRLFFDRRDPRNPGELDYCAAHGIASDIEIIPIKRIEEAFARTVKADVKYRFVIDMSTL